MSSKDAHLYGVPRARKTPTTKPIISTTSSLSFSTALSSLISTSTTSKLPISTTNGRPRPPRKDDIFLTHNRNTKKRALADISTSPDPTSLLAARSQNSSLDAASWRRTKRKMEEKARLYAAMKRGDIEDDQEKHMVDFDRKWAERDQQHTTSSLPHSYSSSSSSDNDNNSEAEAEADEQEPVQYTDEFGRTRTGTRSEAQRCERRNTTTNPTSAAAAAAAASDAADRFTARPVQPAKLIFGDAVQVAAFDPEAPVKAAMEELAKKRDRELTPPEERHYDAASEVRSKGTGFFQFSRDEGMRREEMRGLEEERGRTEKVRGERERKREREGEGRREERRREVEERRTVIRERKAKLQANRFLDGLGSEILDKVEVGPQDDEKG